MGTGIGVGIAGQVYDLKPGVPGGGPPAAFSNKYAMNFIPASSQALTGSATPLLGTGGTGAWSVSVWIYMNSIPGINRRILDINYGGSERFQLFYKSSTNAINVSGAWTDNDPTTFLATTWYNIIYMYDGVPSTSNNARFAVNGTNYNAKSNAVWNQTDVAGTTTIGANNSGTGGFWDGYIDEVSIYNKYLSDAECVELYNGGTPTDLSSASFSANLQHWWRMGDPNGTSYYPTIPDAQGSINMTMQNMVAANIQTTIVP
tara:strand:- start:575 stop:1354 length:780 start_codon:yes stop_codon:yes gene_type:complete